MDKISRRDLGKAALGVAASLGLPAAALAQSQPAASTADPLWDRLSADEKKLALAARASLAASSARRLTFKLPEGSEPSFTFHPSEGPR